MKALFSFLILAFLAMSFTYESVEKNPPGQAKNEFVVQPVDAAYLPDVEVVANKYGYGFRKAVTLTSDTLITISPQNMTLTFATLAMDTSVVMNAIITRSIIGDQIVLKATADGTNRMIDFTGNMIAVNDSVVANKTKVFQFIYDGSRFIQLSEIQTD